MDSCLRKRKREGAGQLEQSNVVGLEDVPYPEWVDLNRPHDFPLPPGWEQCLDLQSGEIYFVNSATQMRAVADPRWNLASLQGNNGLSVGQKIVNDPCVQQHNGMWSNSSLNLDRPASMVTGNSNTSMTATVCLHCHTFVMVSRQSPHCPNCMNICNVAFLQMSPAGNCGA